MLYRGSINNFIHTIFPIINLKTKVGHSIAYHIKLVINNGITDALKSIMEEDGVKKFWQARGRGGKEAREEEKGGSNQQIGVDCWFGKRKN